VDSDLAEAVAALKEIFEKRSLPAKFGKADAATIDRLKKELKVPPRFRAFLAAADPLDVETKTPVEKVRLFPSSKLFDAQFVEGGQNPPRPGWRKNWVVIGESALLGDPYFLDVAKLDAESDCPVLSCMNGTDTVKPVVVASSFQQFIRILATAMEVATGFRERTDEEDEQIFRETLAPKIKTIDVAAMRAGHWT